MKAWAGWALALLLPLAAALAGAPATGRPILLNLGPGDAPYIAGFSPQYEIDEKVATHWTTYDAFVSLPLRIEGPAEVSYRFARIFPQTAQVVVEAAGQPVDRFSARGGLYEERRAVVPTPGAAALRIRADSHERQDRGLKMDWIAWRPEVGARVHLAGRALWTPLLVIGLVLVLHRAVGWSPGAAALLTLPWSVALTAGLWLDPWTTHRLLRGLPLAVVLFGATGVGIALLLRSRGRVSAESVRVLGALCVAAFLLRALAVNHPAFYYPDLRTHARLVQTVQAAGLHFFVAPSHYIWEHGVWRTEAYGKTYAFPYSPAFHLPFAALGLSYDSLLTAMKLWGAALTLVPLVLVWAFARRAGVSPAGAALMVVIPTYVSRLSFAFLPSLFGHAVDMAFLYWLSGRLPEVQRPRVWITAALGVTACQLAYVSGVTNMSLFVGLLAVCAAWAFRERAAGQAVDGRLGLAVLSFGLAGSALSVALYYRDFLGMAADMATRIAGRVPSASRYAVRGFWEVAAGRTWDFFHAVYPLLAVAGLVRLFRRDEPAARGVRTVAAAWLLTYFVLLLGRARIPDVFLHGHETLLLTPLVCLAAGEVLGAWWRAGGVWRALSMAVAAYLVGEGVWLSWQALASQTANAL